MVLSWCLVFLLAVARCGVFVAFCVIVLWLRLWCLVRIRVVLLLLCFLRFLVAVCLLLIIVGLCGGRVVFHAVCASAYCYCCVASCGFLLCVLC